MAPGAHERVTCADTPAGGGAAGGRQSTYWEVVGNDMQACGRRAATRATRRRAGRSPVGDVARHRRQRSSAGGRSTGPDGDARSTPDRGDRRQQVADEPARRDRPGAARAHRRARRSRSSSSSTTTRSPRTRGRSTASRRRARRSPVRRSTGAIAGRAGVRRATSPSRRTPSSTTLAAVAPDAQVGQSLRTVYGGVAADRPGQHGRRRPRDPRRRRRAAGRAATSR